MSSSRGWLPVLAVISVAEQAVEREHDVGVAGGVGHDLPRPDARLRVQQSVEREGGVRLGAGDDDRAQPGVVVGGRAERGHATAAVGERQLGVVVDDPGIRRGECVGAQLALRDVAQA